MFSLVIPFHSDFQRVISILPVIENESSKYEIKEILLCHNGQNQEAYTALEPYVRDNIRLLHTQEKGIGAAYRLGIKNATELYTVLSASDLPFGFSDIENFFKTKKAQNSFLELAVGSKLHALSNIDAYPRSRKIYSKLFYFARVCILGSSTPKDSQGSIIGKSSLLKDLVEIVCSKDYFFSLEILTVALQQSVSVVELPVVLSNHNEMSSVSPIADGISMLSRLFELRNRMRMLNDITSQ